MHQGFNVIYVYLHTYFYQSNCNSMYNVSVKHKSQTYGKIHDCTVLAALYVHHGSDLF